MYWESLAAASAPCEGSFSLHRFVADRIFRNATLACDPSTFALTLDPDQYYWTQDNITALCTSSCQQSAVQWNNNVQTACGGYNITLDSRSVPIATVAGRYLDGLNVACLDDGSGGNCLLDSQEWVGSDLFYNSDGSPATEQNLTGMYPSSLVCSSDSVGHTRRD